MTNNHRHALVVLGLLAAGLGGCGSNGGASEPAPEPSSSTANTPSNDPFVPANDPVPADTGAADTAPSVDPDPTPSADSAPPSKDTSTTSDDTSTPPAPDTSAPPADTAKPADSGPVADTAKPAGKPADPPPPPATASATEYAPYFYAWGWGNPAYSFSSLVDMQKKVGINAATLAFVLSNGGSCAASRDIQSHLGDVSAFVKAGGRVKASFGGAGGNYLENACATSTSLASAVIAFVDETGITDLDFDVEQSVAMTSTVNARRSAALAAVQAARPAVKIAFTLAAEPKGMTSAAFEVVKSAAAAKVAISHVNLMTMDYGPSFSAGKAMGDLAVSAINGCVSQLRTLYPSLTDDALYGMTGATAMIGQNDEPTEVFSLADAKTLIAFAKSKHVGLVSFWAIQRDRPCAGTVDLALCSNAQTANYQFSDVFKTAL